MILDQFAVFFDNISMSETMESAPVHVSAFAGRDEPVNICVLVRGPGQLDLSITVQESEAADGAFTDLGGVELSKTDDLPMIRMLRLPLETRMPFVRLKLEAAGAGAEQRIFAGVSRDMPAPYESGLYIDARGIR